MELSGPMTTAARKRRPLGDAIAIVGLIGVIYLGLTLENDATGPYRRQLYGSSPVLGLHRGTPSSSGAGEVATAMQLGGNIDAGQGLMRGSVENENFAHWVSLGGLRLFLLFIMFLRLLLTLVSCMPFFSKGRECGEQTS